MTVRHPVSDPFFSEKLIYVCFKVTTDIFNTDTFVRIAIPVILNLGCEKNVMDTLAENVGSVPLEIMEMVSGHICGIRFVVRFPQPAQSKQFIGNCYPSLGTFQLNRPVEDVPKAISRRCGKISIN